jgi:hypothetical protein
VYILNAVGLPNGSARRVVVSRKPPLAPAAIALIGLAAVAAACSGQSSGPTLPVTATATSATAASTLPPAQATTAPATPAAPTTFTSPIYGYSLTLPAGWAIGAAVERWDGTSAVGHTEPFVDKLATPGTLSFFAFETQTQLDLAGFVQDRIAANVRDHSDTCPKPTPDANEPLQVAGKPGVFLAWNCGILINEVVTVRDGVAFVIVARDTAIPAATDAADRAILDQLLATLAFPT